MTTFSTSPLDRLDGLEIHLRRVTVPAFGGKRGHWTNYEAVLHDGITSMTVDPVLRGYVLDKTHPYLDIHCHFDPETFPSEKYGIVYGDGLFEIEIRKHILAALGLSPDLEGLSYTEAGMQGEDYISMESSAAFAMHLAALSNHAWLDLTRNPDILSVFVQGFSWQREEEISDRE